MIEREKDQVRTVRIAHSPDSDDAFMFHALSTGRVTTPGIRYEHVLSDIETLNRAALGEARYEVSAISFHAYPRVRDRYLVMPCGASMGEGYGPVVVAARPLDSLDGRRVALPGALTSAALAARLHSPGLIPVHVPFDRVADAVRSGEAEAGVLIHEGQLTWAADGLVRVVDLGVWWAEEQDGLPLPLGCNIVRRDLGPLVGPVTAAVRDSIVAALEEREAALDFAMSYARGLDRGLADRFVGMYVNGRTVDLGPDGREAVARLLRLGHERGLLAGPVDVDWVELDPAPHPAELRA